MLCNQWHTTSPIYVRRHRHHKVIFCLGWHFSCKSQFNFNKHCMYFLFLCSCLLALLPPNNRIRPRTPPPPPPTNSEEVKSAKFHTSPPKVIEQLETSKAKKVAKPSLLYENEEFHNKLGAALSINATGQQTTSPRRTGILRMWKNKCVNVWLINALVFSEISWMQLKS